jgi:hypothetical protein
MGPGAAGRGGKGLRSGVGATDPGRDGEGPRGGVGATDAGRGGNGLRDGVGAVGFMACRDCYGASRPDLPMRVTPR